MASPAYGTNTTAGNANGTSLTINKPTSTASGDILLALLTLENADSITPPSGWTKLTAVSGTQSGAATAYQFNAYWLRAGGSEPANYTWSWTNSNHRSGTIVRYTGAVASGDPWEASTGLTISGSAGTSVATPTVTTTTIETLLIYLQTDTGSNATIATATERVDFNRVYMADESLATATTSTSRTITLGSSQYYTVATLALRSVAGTAYTQSLDGGLTPAGALVKSIGKVLAGTVTPAGALVKAVAAAFSGAVTPAGGLVKSVGKVLAGGLTPSGALAAVKVTLLSIGGAVTPAGALVKQAGKNLAGGLAPAGALVKAVAATMAGAVTPTGGLARSVGKALAGALAPVGGLVKLIGKLLAGAVGPAGDLANVYTPGAGAAVETPGRGRLRGQALGMGRALGRALGIGRGRGDGQGTGRTRGEPR